MTRSLFGAAMVALFTVRYASGADANKPHMNKGVGAPFKPGLPKDLKLSSSDLAVLKKGKTVQRQVRIAVLHPLATGS